MTTGSGPAREIVLAAHGTRDTKGRATVEALAKLVADRVTGARLTWLEICHPLLSEVVATQVAPLRVVPLLLSGGFHERSDLPGLLAGHPGAQTTSVLGGDDRVVDALHGRLVEAGWAGEPVVLAVAGSSDEHWHEQTAVMAHRLGERIGLSVAVGVLTGADSPPDPTSPQRRVSVQARIAGLRECGYQRVAVSTFLLAEGFFWRRAQQSGADLLAGPLGVHPALVDLIAERCQAA